MRLSVWHQFSSNHSADFAIIGTFESAEKAQQAMATLRELLDSIARWYDAPANGGNPWYEWDWSTGQPPPPSGAERAIGENYGFDWPHAIDWFDEYVLGTSFQDNVIMLTSAGDTEIGVSPVHILVERLGAHVAASGVIVGRANLAAIGVDLTCTAPSKEEAARIQNLVNEHITRRLEVEIPLPWRMSFWDGEVRRDGAKLQFVGMGLSGVTVMLPRWLDQLKQSGYTDIQYTFRTIDG